MRFYLNAPLVIGYVLMATSACLGMLQLAAARGGYSGLSLFSTDQQQGSRFGAGLTVGALLAYVLFAPEILTPGPAGSEVAEMFALCALVALAITLLGADRRLKRERKWHISDGEAILLGSLPATLHRPSPPSEEPAPAVVLLPDPTEFVCAPQAIVEQLCQAGFAVLALDARGVAKSEAPLSRRTLLGHISTALVQLTQQAGIDAQRSGLLGLGLGGDAVLRAAASDPLIKVVVVVAPMAGLASETSVINPGLQWLNESSYRQIWRWRRRRPAFQRAAADLEGPAKPSSSAAIAILQANEPTETMRTQHDVEWLMVPDQRRFTALEDTHVLAQTVSWLQEKLDTNNVI